MSFIFRFTMKVLAFVLNGIALHFLWQWFVVELFYLLPPISWAQSVGLATLLKFLTDHHIPREKDDRWSQFLYTITNPALALLIGYAAHLLVVDFSL